MVGSKLLNKRFWYAIDPVYQECKQDEKRTEANKDLSGIIFGFWKLIVFILLKKKKKIVLIIFFKICTKFDFK